MLRLTFLLLAALSLLPATARADDIARPTVSEDPATWPDVIDFKGSRDLSAYGYRLSRRPRIGLAISGGAVLATGIVSQAVTAGGTNHLTTTSEVIEFVPLVGPGIASIGGGSASWIGRHALGLAAQVAGGTMLAFGLIGKRAWRRSLVVTPTLGPGQVGLNAQGRF